MITAKVGNSIINCFDGKYNKSKLKEWSSKNLLKCPDCGELYEYCHGQIKLPYFRHKDKNKDCTGLYYEPETQEHILGKLLLHNWLEDMQNKGIVSNLRLEAYIPETKQRPDIYFEINGTRYVIEYQCTPISTQYLERHELYELAGVKDIWILGTKNFNIQFIDGKIYHANRYKEIENHVGIYLDVDNKELCICDRNLYMFLPFRMIDLKQYYKYNLFDCIIDVSNYSISPNCNILKPFIEKDTLLHDIVERVKVEKREFEENVNDIIEKLNNRYKHVNKDYYFEFVESDTEKYYLWKIIFYNKYNDLYFFIKEHKTDCCYQYNTTRSYCFGGKRGGLGWRKYDTVAYERMSRLEYHSIDINEIYNFICETVSLYLRNKKYKL